MSTQLPPMQAMTGDQAWIGAELQNTPAVWRWHLSASEITQLEQAATAFLDTGKDPGEISADNFPLPDMAQNLIALRRELISGIGFRVISGLPIAEYSRAEAATIFCGIGAHLGRARSQNAAGHILGHVRDTGARPDDPNTRIYQTAARQTFHTDSADAVGLLCLKPAKSGGASLLVSAISIFNRMLCDCPDLLPRLFDPIATDRRGEIPEGAKPFMEIPPLSWAHGMLTVFYQRQYINSAQRFPDALRLGADHVAALDAFDALANDPNLHLSMQLAPGDMQFVYNHAFLHDRTGFEDWPDPLDRRHLLRLWLSLPGDRPLPDCFAERYGTLDIGNRGGIVTPGTVLHAPLD